MLQMSSRNVRVSNLRGSNMMKIDAKSFVEKAKLGENAVVVDETPRRRGRPLKKQINVMFQVSIFLHVTFMIKTSLLFTNLFTGYPRKR